MKSIRFYSILVFSVFILWSCSSNDDGPTGPTVSSQVYGTWRMYQLIENNELIEDIPCDIDIKYKFTSNRNFSKTLFVEAQNGNSCNESVTIEGEWEVIEDNVLKLNPFIDAFDSETVTLEILNSGDLKIKRSNNSTQIYKRI